MALPIPQVRESKIRLGRQVGFAAFAATLIVEQLWCQPPVTGPTVPSLAAFDTVMLNLLSKWQAPGASLAITRDGRLVFARGYGYADTSISQPVQPDALMRIASISKPITAAAVLKLIEQNRLQLSTPAFSVLSDLTPPPGAVVDPRLNQITIQHLLEHKGGWNRDTAGDPPFQYAMTAATAFGTLPPATPDQLVRYMMGKPLQFNPGSASSYSNFGYIVLGAVIARASGMPYEAYVRENVLRTAGVTRMRPGASLPGGRRSGEVKYYDYPGAPLGASIFPPVGSTVASPYGGYSTELLLAAGGWIASAIDLVRVANNLNGQTPPAILASPPFGFVGYIPPFGGGWGWAFYGSLPGTSAIAHLETGYQINGKVTYSVLYNTRPGQPFTRYPGRHR